MISLNFQIHTSFSPSLWCLYISETQMSRVHLGSEAGCSSLKPRMPCNPPNTTCQYVSDMTSHSRVLFLDEVCHNYFISDHISQQQNFMTVTYCGINTLHTANCLQQSVHFSHIHWLFQGRLESVICNPCTLIRMPFCSLAH